MKNIKGGYIAIDMQGINISTGSMTELQKGSIINQLDENVYGNALLLQNLYLDNEPISLWGSYDIKENVLKTPTYDFDLTTNVVYSTGLNKPIYKHIIQFTTLDGAKGIRITLSLLRNNKVLFTPQTLLQFLLTQYQNDIVNGWVINNEQVSAIIQMTKSGSRIEISYQPLTTGVPAPSVYISAQSTINIASYNTIRIQ